MVPLAMTAPIDRRGLLMGAASLTLAVALARAQVSPPPLAQDVALLGAPDPQLEAKIAALATEAGLRIGFAAVDLSKGSTAFVRGGELFPMQGVAQLPLGVAFMQLAQRGKTSLDARVRLTAADIAPGRSPLAARLTKRPTTFTARQLVEHMLLNADATAADALMKLAGGPSKIQDAIKSFDIEGLRIDRYEHELQPEALGLTPHAALADPARFEGAFAALGEMKQREALQRYLRDPRDKASPRAIATLLFKLLSGHLVQPRHAMFLLDLMRRTKTGEDRLKAGMLPGWTFAHRGGMSRPVQGAIAACNDAGLATTKQGAKIAIVLFIENATLPPLELARFHRATARAVLQAWG
jgi:beta-lactamase class A